MILIPAAVGLEIGLVPIKPEPGMNQVKGMGIDDIDTIRRIAFDDQVVIGESFEITALDPGAFPSAEIETTVGTGGQPPSCPGGRLDANKIGPVAIVGGENSVGRCVYPQIRESDVLGT